MSERMTKGNILIYGAEGASEVLEYMLTGCGFGVIRVDDREELAERFKDRSHNRHGIPRR